ncbi:MAG: hypothetical protein ACNA78_10830 [Balneolaceae bacterium]
MKFLNLGSKWVTGVFLFFVILYLAGCDITNPTDGIRAILNMKERTTTVSVILFDAATDEPVGFEQGPDVNITITGPDSDSIIDLLNRPTSSFVSSSGFISFAILDNLALDASSPVRFTIEAQAEGYLPVSQSVFITSTGNNPVEIYMVDINNLPDGVSVVQNMPVGALDAEGRITDEIAFGIDVSGNVFGGAASSSALQMNAVGSLQDEEPPEPPVAAIEQGVRFRMQSGTVITDANGVELSGSLQTTVNYYSPNYRRFSNFAEGVIEGQTGEYIFTRAGIVDIVVKDENGRIAKNFDPAAETTFTYRDQFGMSSGSVISGWGSDQSWPDVWNSEGEKQITQIEDAFGRDMNQTVMELPLFHRWQQLAFNIPACREGIRINLSGTNLRVHGDIRNASTGAYIGSFQSTVTRNPETDEVTGNFIQLNRVPRDLPSVLSFFNLNETPLQEITVQNLCDTSIQNVSINSPEFSATFKGKGVCANNDDIEVRPNFPVQVKSRFGRWRNAGELKNGQIILTLPEPELYTFGGYIEGRFRIYDIDLTNANEGDIIEREIDLPEDVCDDL